ncbi:natural killer cell receptor 2B4 isoform X1 [Petaurus breviceps papuanus]|uniref:natural killer cell receptor 2B4 isoform X1 n=1 Tax=Petaurus breviceps papuanus TaxID=3040969 RepID=UPI0036DD39E3
MLWKAFTPLIFLVMLQDQVTLGSDMKTTSMPIIVGSLIKLQPIRIQQYSESKQFIWSVKLSSTQEKFRIVSWTANSKVTYEDGQFKNRVNVKTENMTLFISPAQKNDSGLYFMEITSVSGHVSETSWFQVSVFDPVQDPKIQVTGVSWNNTLCQVNLSCFVHGDNNLTYTWYRGREQIKPPGKHAHVQLHIQARSTENYYTCNASNPVSSRSHTTNLTWVCASPVYSPIRDMNMTSYTKISRKPRRNQMQNFCGTEEGNTLYSVVQFPNQLPVSRPGSQDKTVYAAVHFSKRQPFPKQMSPSSSCSATIYQEVQRPNRLSYKEMEMFRIYS